MSRRTFTDDEAADLIQNRSLKSVAAVLRALGTRLSGGAYDLVWRVVRTRALDTSHWTGKLHALGKRAPNRKHVSVVLVLNGPKLNSHDIKLRLIRDGLKEHKCERCTLREWQGLPIPLDLHHINGNRRDNRLFNLQLLCPNCHALTPNYCAKNILSRRMVDREQQIGDFQKI